MTGNQPGPDFSDPQIALLPYERQALETLEQKYAIEREITIAFACALNYLACLFQEVSREGEAEFRAGRVVLIGLINHVHHLLAGGLQAIEVGNSPVWSACVRGLMETFGATVIISEQPASAPNHLTYVKAGALRAAAERGQPGLGGDIDRLNRIVHPVSGAIFAGFRVHDEAERVTTFHFGLQCPTSDEGREGIIVLANLAKLIADKIQALVSQSDVLTAGKLIMVRT